jgi:hypothetical protein
MCRGDIVKKFVNLLPAIFVAVAMLASHPAVAAADAVTVVATINGGGTALMTSPPGAQPGFKNVSSFGIHATLYSDFLPGSTSIRRASGHVDCVDLHGDFSPGNIFGDVTGWSEGPYGLTLWVTGRLVAGSDNDPAAFPLTIQSFGGAGVGHWTLGKLASPFCVELLLSGQLVENLN